MYNTIPIWGEKKNICIYIDAQEKCVQMRNGDLQIDGRKRALKIDKIWKVGWVLTLTWV